MYSVKCTWYNVEYTSNNGQKYKRTKWQKDKRTKGQKGQRGKSISQTNLWSVLLHLRDVYVLVLKVYACTKYVKQLFFLKLTGVSTTTHFIQIAIAPNELDFCELLFNQIFVYARLYSVKKVHTSPARLGLRAIWTMWVVVDNPVNFCGLLG